MKGTFSKSEASKQKGGKNWPIYQKKISFEWKYIYRRGEIDKT
nr:MAG TPA: hypothetical protein [Caudoviricetes sp.]